METATTDKDIDIGTASPPASRAELEAISRELGVRIPFSDDLALLSKPVKVDGLSLPNSIAIQPMEGRDAAPDGGPGELTFRRYERFAAGGAGLIWAEATAVTPEGKAGPDQLWIKADNVGRFTELVKHIRNIAQKKYGDDHNPAVILQLTHSGRYSKRDAGKHPLIPQNDPYRNGRMNLPDEYPTVSDEYLDKLQEGYLEAAELAFDAGFDGVDIKACHGYLINELLASYQREGRYGGSFENRTRFLLEVIGKIKDRLGDEKVVTTRLGIYDGIPYPYGWGVDRQDYHKPDLAEPLKLVGLLEKRGVDMINISIANPYYNPHFNRPFTRQKQANEEISEHPLTGVERIIKLAGVVQRTYPDLTVIGSGYSWLGTLLPHVAAGAKEEGLATIIGAGRMAIAYPDFVRDIIQKGRLDADRICTTCGACSELMRADKPTGCVVRDGEVYGRRNE